MACVGPTCRMSHAAKGAITVVGALAADSSPSPLLSGPSLCHSSKMNQSQGSIESLIGPLFGENGGPLFEAIAKSYRETTSAKARVTRLKEEIEECDKRVNAQEAHSSLLQNEVNLLEFKCKRIEDLLEENQKRINEIMAGSRKEIQEAIIDPTTEAVQLTESTCSSLNELLTASNHLHSLFSAKDSNPDFEDKGVQVFLSQGKNQSGRKFATSLVENQKRLHEMLKVLDQLKAYSANAGRIPQNFISSHVIDNKKKEIKWLKDEVESLTKSLAEKNASNGLGQDQREDTSTVNIDLPEEELDSNRIDDSFPSDELGPTAPDAIPVAMETIGADATDMALSILSEEAAVHGTSHNE